MLTIIAWLTVIAFVYVLAVLNILLLSLGEVRKTTNITKEKVNIMLAQIAALQTAVQTAVTGIDSDLDSIASQIATLKSSPTLGADDISALNSIGSTVAGAQAKADTLATPAAPIASATMTTQNSGAVAEGQQQ